MESGERLRPGDLAITTSDRAGSPRIGEGVLVIVEDSDDPNAVASCYRVHKFCCGDDYRSFVHPDFLKLYWRPDATAE